MDAKVEKASAISARNNGLFAEAAPCKAYVLGNEGDPGLETDLYCDIRSRFVLAIKDPLKRPLVPQNSDGSKIFLQDNLILVLRPRHLWVDVPLVMNTGTVNPSQIKRRDASGNINIGSQASFNQSDISSISSPYIIGEEITVQRLKDYVTADDTPFQSFFSMSLTAGLPFVYPNIDFLGQTLPNAIGANGTAIGGGKDTSYFDRTKNYFYITLPKSSYENFISSYFVGRGFLPAAGVAPYYEYYFGTRQYVTFRCAAYIDMNTSNKIRQNNSACLPSIITPPDSFLTPRERQTTYSFYTKV